ncbi:acyltransferase family protein [Lacrimispora algidixylanolytica]|uniref:acyltransferase family protein n=1 Tax=Lacrimispora algidixylanolytica TaxID=94868 RepID=UPI001314EDF7|nr:acyltransferase [Lacrimispora algidixylanolytica]
MEKKINYQFKVLYVLGIIFVVAGHSSANSGLNIMTNWFHLYSFHLGIFVFSSGYFYSEKAKDNFFLYMWNKVKRLLVPLYLWNVIYGILVILLKAKGFSMGGEFTLRNLLLTPILTGHQFIYNLGGWFIVPLFCVEIFHVMYKKIFGKVLACIGGNYFTFVAYLLLGMTGVYFCSKGFNFGWYLVLFRMLIFLPFYAAGNLYRNNIERKDNLRSLYYLGIVFIIQLAIITRIGYPPYYDWAFCSNFKDGVILPYICAFTGIAFWIRIARIITPILKNNLFMLKIADNTYSIMLHHLLGIMFAKTLFAIICKYTKYCHDFDWVSYKTELWWTYFPKGLTQWGLLYLVFGIMTGLLAGKIERNVVKTAKRLKLIMEEMIYDRKNMAS